MYFSDLLALPLCFKSKTKWRWLARVYKVVFLHQKVIGSLWKTLTSLNPFELWVQCPQKTYYTTNKFYLDDAWLNPFLMQLNNVLFYADFGGKNGETEAHQQIIQERQNLEGKMFANCIVFSCKKKTSLAFCIRYFFFFLLLPLHL